MAAGQPTGERTDRQTDSTSPYLELPY